ncbi:1,4-dihydroxy-2-naphthoate polyprenyltransferase [Demequina oxidasica]|uniref:1,4-dihydroxy-2-naphthoate polyprenyltransferase n=1 Tax=Demequina oxidasica TaxID=676199 RepID=UPI000783003E|nr:1,4-dihydroxy-2-naphthoate polyprenyltransferase [Demequina oxidasica]
MPTINDWVAGSRPRTLWTAIAPVAVGTAAASAQPPGQAAAVPALLALGVALAMQIAVNFANDYSDGVKGTDLDRIGPDRLVATGKATPTQVKRAAYMSFTVAALLGVALILVSGLWWLAPIGIVAIIAAWTYTGSSKPYGYSGWGEISVFVFFGPVAVLGTEVTQANAISWIGVLGSIGVGLYAVALLMVNNIRDLETDALAGKHTLAVKIGDLRARQLFAITVLLPIVIVVIIAFSHPWALIATVVALPSLLLAIAMRVSAVTTRMPLVFGGISAVGLTYGLLLAIGIAL